MDAGGPKAPGISPVSSVTGEAGRPARLSLEVCRSSTTRFMLCRGRIPVLEASYLQDLDAECLKPGEKPVQGRLILNGTVQDGFDRLHRGGKPGEVKQGLRRENSSHADLVVGRWHRSPQSIRNWAWPVPNVPLYGSPHPTHDG